MKIQEILKKMSKKEEGFTLVELLIVVAIIAILAAIAIPQFSKYRMRAYITEVNSDAKNAYTAAQAYLTDRPADTVGDLAGLQLGGYAKSPNVTVRQANMTLTGGTIRLNSTVSGLAKNNTIIHANGKINQASN